MRIREQFGDLTGKRLFDFIPLDEDSPRQQQLIQTWSTHFKNIGVPFVILERANYRQSNFYPMMTVMYKEKYVGEMRDLVSFESLVGEGNAPMGNV